MDRLDVASLAVVQKLVVLFLLLLTSRRFVQSLKRRDCRRLPLESLPKDSE